MTNMSNMFGSVCSKSQNFTLNLGNHFNTSKVTNMSYMFSFVGQYNDNFTLNLGNYFNTSNVTSMSGMFYYTGHNSTNFILNLGNNFNTSKVTDMSSMFYFTGENSTWTLNLQSFNFSKVGSNYSYFFTNRYSSKLLTVLCDPSNCDFINARVSGLSGFEVING